MSLLTSIDVSSSGLTAERKRMNTISSNIANANVTRTPEGGPYRRKDVVFGTKEVDTEFAKVMDEQMKGAVNGVEVKDVVSDLKAPRMVYDPNHPEANPEGYVAYPNVNTVEELTNMIEAQRSYEANVTALNASKRMALKALDIGNN